MLNNTYNGTIVLKDYVDLNLIDLKKSSIEIVSNIFPKDYSKVHFTKLFCILQVFFSISEIYYVLNKTDEIYQLMQKLPHTKVYKKENIPSELNFKRNNRIAPLVAITDEGYVLDCCSLPNSTLLGNHGYEGQ